jgi:oligoribonuclease
MAETTKDALVWLDMEMTGLDPEQDVPIEVAIIVTTKELAELEVFESTIWQPDSKLELMSPYVRNMHTVNGLLERVRKSEVELQRVEKYMINVLMKWCAPFEGVLCGNSIHQDRRFLVKYFPAFDRLLSYRMVDVSSVKELVRRWYGQSAMFSKSKGEHTALSDIRESIDELRHYRANCMKPQT